MKEIWKPIKGYEGRYSVSNTGKPCKRVICIETKKVYNSITEAADDCKTYRSQIRRAIRNNGIAGGYTWQDVH